MRNWTRDYVNTTKMDILKTEVDRQIDMLDKASDNIYEDDYPLFQEMCSLSGRLSKVSESIEENPLYQRYPAQNIKNKY